MHMYVFVRAERRRLDLWMNDLNARTFEWTGTRGQRLRQRIQIRELKPIELVFPRENLKEVKSIVYPYDYDDKFKPYIYGMRKACKLKPIVRDVLPDPTFNNQNVNRIGIGIKEDDEHEQWPGVEKI